MNTQYDLQLVRAFGITCRKFQMAQIKEVYFKLPRMNQVLICCDGISRGNPGNAGFGFIARSSEGQCIGAGEWAMAQNLESICLCSD